MKKRLIQSARDLLGARHQLRPSPTIPPPRHGLPFPPRVHVVLGRDEVRRHRQILVVGDVHGCVDELSELLAAAGADKEDGRTLVIFAGDMINKGPDSAAVLRKIRARSHLAVRGNNEEAMLREYCRRKQDADYVISESYRWMDSLEADDVAYLFALPYTVMLPSLKAVIVHAGLVPGRPLRDQHPADMVSMRNLLPRAFLPERTSATVVTTKRTDTGAAWAPEWRGPQHVYFGHDAVRGLQLCRWATGLDTGCVYGGCLTGVFISGQRHGEILSVPAKKVYRKSKEEKPEAGAV